jgi:hypothetical protein
VLIVMTSTSALSSIYILNSWPWKIAALSAQVQALTMIQRIRVAGRSVTWDFEFCLARGEAISKKSARRLSASTSCGAWAILHETQQLPPSKPPNLAHPATRTATMLKIWSMVCREALSPRLLCNCSVVSGEETSIRPADLLTRARNIEAETAAGRERGRCCGRQEEESHCCAAPRAERYVLSVPSPPLQLPAIYLI